MVAALSFTQLFVAVAAPPSPPPDQDLRVPAAATVAPEAVASDKRASVLGNEWATSTDRSVTTAGDASGFHVLVADAKDGYQWRTAASLSEPGFDVDAWIGNMCVTASGDRAVVAYAPRTFTNKADLAQRGAFTAIVDLNGGPVRKLPIRTSLAYFNPGCGPTETAVLTQEGTEDLDRTRLLELDTATGATARPIEIPGQLTSPVPTAHGIVAADSGAVVRVAADGTRTVLARAKGVPYRLAADADGGVVFVQSEGDKDVSVQRVSVPATGKGALTTLATGDVMDVNVASVRGGQVFVTGDKSAKVRSTPASVRLADVGKNAQPSLEGGVAVTKVLRTHTKDPRVAPADPLSPQRVDVSAVSMETGKEFTLSVTPVDGAGGGNEPSPALPAGVTAGSPSDPSEGTDERYCSVPRNNPTMQVTQPKPRQVEWAVNQAVRNVLTVPRPANWKGLGMPAYTPQGLFPSRSLTGGGNLPSQVMLGVLAQESNLWQAARFAIPGMTANPLIGNYYGIDYYNDTPSDDWTIRWNEADCGYGVGQITDGMRLAGKEKPNETALPWNSQRAIALDFAANIAKAVQMLQEKWNQTRAAGLVINDGQSKWIENWFFAVWAYNSGFYPENTAGQNDGAWGVGWLNNPVNPRYPADRTPFLDESYSDAAHPQDWPYPEKVMGWAGHPIELIESPNVLVHGYRAAWWLTEQDRWDVKPSNYEFCNASNDCNPDLEITPDDPEVIGEPAGPCAHKNSNGKYDLKCWYHESAGWKDCADQTCGNELLRFDPGYAYQEDGNSHPPNCSLSGLPPGALVIDNLPTSTPPQRPGCTIPHTNAGSFTFNFRQSGGLYPSKVDIHQIGTGFAGQFWMSNTHQDYSREALGTWAFNRSVGPWGRILVHLPVVGARTQQAHYEIDTGSGVFNRSRYLPQEIRRNGWVSLGVYNFTGTPRVRLSNVTEDGHSTDRIAWDAIAIQPLSAKPRHIVAALGDSFSSGEGAGPSYLISSNVNHGTPQWNACRRSTRSWSRDVLLPGTSTPLGQLSDGFSANHELGFVACSGAKTWNVTGDGVPISWQSPDRYDTGEGQFHEMSQLESGVLDENTTLVTMTIGGNDENGFTDAVVECVVLPQCQNAPYFMDRYQEIADIAVTNTENLLNRVALKARNARIVLMGYPELMSRSRECVTSQLELNEQVALGEVVEYLTLRQGQMITRLKNAGLKVSYMSMVPEFAGHGGCDTPEWINTIRIGPNGEGDFHPGDKPTPFCIPFTGNCMSRESFHPNLYGTAAYAFALRLELNEIGYT